jgi:hypothetical protein
MPSVGAPWKAAMGSSSERGKRGKEEEGCRRGRYGEGLRATAATCVFSTVHERTRREEGEKEESEKKKERKEKEKKKTIWKIL